MEGRIGEPDLQPHHIAEEGDLQFGIVDVQVDVADAGFHDALPSCRAKLTPWRHGARSIDRQEMSLMRHVRLDLSRDERGRNRDDRDGSQSIDHPSYAIPHHRDIEVEKIAKPPPTELQVTQQLGSMHIRDFLDGLDLYDHQVRYE